MITEITHNDKVVGLLTDLEPITDVSKYHDLRFIATPCTGIDHIKVQGYDIIHLDDEWKQGEGVLITSTAEHTWSLILQLAKMKRMQLSEKTIGIIGCGRIGQMIVDYAKAFFMNVIFNDKFNILCVGESDEIKCSSLNFLLENSDIITIHVPLNDETRGMIGKEQFEMMKPGALLVNTSRADVVDRNSLIDALKNDKIGGYADDFLKENEIYIADIDYCHKDIIQTPHIGGNCIEARQATDAYIMRKIDEYLRRMP